MCRALWNDRYAAAAADASTVWSLAPNTWIASVAKPLPAGRAVDLAAGEGRHALWLAARGWEVTAVDFSPVGLATGARRAAEHNLDVRFVEADATEWVSDTPVDLVVIAYFQVTADALAKAIDNAASYLAPGGTLALINHDRVNIEHGVGGPQDPAILTTVSQLRNAAAGLSIAECRQWKRTTDAGVAIDTILLAHRGR